MIRMDVPIHGLVAGLRDFLDIMDVRGIWHVLRDNRVNLRKSARSTLMMITTSKHMAHATLTLTNRICRNMLHIAPYAEWT